MIHYSLKKDCLGFYPVSDVQTLYVYYTPATGCSETGAAGCGSQAGCGHGWEPGAGRGQPGTVLSIIYLGRYGKPSGI